MLAKSIPARLGRAEKLAVFRVVADRGEHRVGRDGRGAAVVPSDRFAQELTLDSDFDGPTFRTPDFAFPADGSIGHLDAGFGNFLD